MTSQAALQDEVERLRARFDDTRDLYREVCALLFFRFGVTPTANKLYQLVRKGTMATPADVLAKFWEELRARSRVELDRPDLPQAVRDAGAEAIAQLWRQATAAARDELGAMREEATAQETTARTAQAAAEADAVKARATLELVQAELAKVHAARQQVQADLLAERQRRDRAEARLQEAQDQLEQARRQQQRLQDGFSADLAKAGEAVEAADRRAAAAEKRALMDIDQERQARLRADKSATTLQDQLAQAHARERKHALEQADALARLQARGDALQVHCDSLEAAARDRREREAGERDAHRALQADLAARQHEVLRLQAEATAVQALLDRLSPLLQSARPARKRHAPAG